MRKIAIGILVGIAVVAAIGATWTASDVYFEQETDQLIALGAWWLGADSDDADLDIRDTDGHVAATISDEGATHNVTFSGAVTATSFTGAIVEDVEDLTTQGGAGTAPLSDGSNGLTMTDVLTEAELDSEAELESQLVDVTNVYTNTDGDLDDDDVTDDNVESMTSAGSVGTVPLVTSAGVLTMTDVLTEAELDTIGELEAQLTDVTNVIVGSEIDTLSELETIMSGINIIASTEIDTESELEALLTDVTDVYTDLDGALDDDDVTDDNVETMATAGGAGTVPMSDGAAHLTMTDVLVPTEIDTEAELEALLTDVTDVYTDLDGALDDDDITDDVIGDLSDVDTTGAALGSILKYDGSDWVIGIDATGSGTVPDGNADNDVLLWDETTTQTWLATSAANFKAALDLEVGTDLQAYNAELAGIASATLSSAGTLYTDGSQGYSLKVIGTDIQAYDAALAGVAGASGAGLYYTDGSDNISLKAIGTDIQAQDADLEGISDATLTTAGLLYTDGSQTYSTKATRSKAILLTAAGGTPATTDGCADAALSANDIYTLDFDASTDENAVWMLPLPEDYASGDFAVTFYYSVASDWADSADKVNWAIKGVSLANSEALNGAYGTAVEANDVWDTGETVNEMLTVAASSDLSITGVAAGEFVKICVYRDADDATNDTCTADGRLIAVKLEYTASIY